MPEGSLNKKSMTKEAREGLVVERFYKALFVEPIRNSRLVDLSFESKDSSLAATVANTIAKRLHRLHDGAEVVYNFRERPQTSSVRLATESKIGGIGAGAPELQGKSTALFSFTRSRPEGKRECGAMQRLAGLNASLIKAQTERLEAELPQGSSGHDSYTL